MNKREAILYFGSFNPIHNGHTAIARYLLKHGFCDELWFVVSPQNPLKPESVLVSDLDRLRMAEIAVREQLNGLNVSVSDVEFDLPRPSYTIDTLRYLDDRFPDYSFSLLVGADIMPQIDRWKEAETLVRDYKLYVYPRERYALDHLPQSVVYLKDAPLFECSSTEVREEAEKGSDISGMVSQGVGKYIVENGLWASKNSK